MRTTVDINSELLGQVMALGGFTTKKAAVNEALAQYVGTCRRSQILEVAGEIDFCPEYDHKAARRAR